MLAVTVWRIVSFNAGAILQFKVSEEQLQDSFRTANKALCLQCASSSAEKARLEPRDCSHDAIHMPCRQVPAGLIWLATSESRLVFIRDSKFAGTERLLFMNLFVLYLWKA